MTMKTDDNKLKELNNTLSNILAEMGFYAYKKRTREKSYFLPVYKMTDGTLYKYKNTMLISNKTVISKIKLDCKYILDEYALNGWVPQIEDMSKEEILKYCEKHSQ